ncbi:MAG TPA: hypothetical protein VH062_26260 [Polyangiaceae bacterium]|jgi:hypothetical protein|nr:hypothetical protein [Polyangiaceae bacterium]
MSDPMRLSEAEPDGFAASLIRAGRRETPSDALRRASALGAGVTVASAFASKAAASGFVTKTILVSALQGMILGAVVTATLVTVPRLFSTPPTKARTETERHATAPHARTPRDVSDEKALPAPANEPASDDRRAPPRVPFTAKRAPTVEAARAATTQVVEPTNLSDELRAFELAQGAFARADLSTASAALEQYQREYAHGTLALEADVLRIEILAARGDVAGAHEKARAFLAANPTAPAARRVRSLLTKSEARTSR